MPSDGVWSRPELAEPLLCYGRGCFSIAVWKLTAPDGRIGVFCNACKAKKEKGA